MITSAVLLSDDIKVGEHPTISIFGLVVNSDTLLATAIAGAVLIGLGLYMRARLTSGVPSKIQLAFETLVNYVEEQVESAMGVKAAPFVVPLAVTLFAFILISNWVEVVPTQEHVPSPTADINLTAALALFVVCLAHVTGFRKKGVRGYVKSFTGAPRWLIPFRGIEEIAKPLSLALRLFGNLFAGGLMIALIGLFPSYILWAPTVIWKLFDMFIGVIQALIFSLLTIVYFSFAVNEGGH
jgi:F-type H+-transporting ATPase subunit a